jgi:hypothetical protein
MVQIFDPGEDRLLYSQIAKRTGISAASLRRWRREGRLKAVRIGARHFVTREDWAAFVESCNAKPRTRPDWLPGGRKAGHKPTNAQRADRRA